MKNQRVAVLRGGPSEEYEVSLQTGEGVLSALRDRGIKTTDILINKQGDWLVDGFTKDPQTALLACDVAFVALHGSYGEDGTVQRLLGKLGVPYTGSRPYPSALAMNKLLAKETLVDSGIKMPSHMRVTRDGTDIARVVDSIVTLFGPRYVVKPINSGSSLGVYLADGPVELTQVLNEALKSRDEVLVEEYIIGTEATVGVVEGLRGEPYYSLPAIEIVVPDTHSFFANDVKYDGSTEEICPGRFSTGQKEELATAAMKAHKLLGLSQYSRSDFILNDTGVYFLEINTLPGLTKESLFPRALSAVGHNYDDFVLHLLEQAR